MMFVRSVVIAVSLVAIAPGCAGRHVLLEAPAPNAHAAERLAAYHDLSPVAAAGQAGEAAAVTTRSTEYLVLRDGRRVYRADDLAAVVTADSPTARAAARSRRARKLERVWLGIAGGVLAGGVYFAARSLMRTVDSDSHDDDFEAQLDRAGLELGIAVGLGLFTTVPVTVAAHYGKLEQDERVSAFATYDESLRQRLSVCVDGLKVVDCGTSHAARR